MALVEQKRDPSPRELWVFVRILFPVFFALVGGLVFHWTGALAVAIGIWGLAGALTLAGLARRRWARALYRGWLSATHPIAWTVSSLVMALIYYLAITPVGLLLRLTGGDALGLRRDASTDSHWTRYDPDENVERYLKQF